MSNLHLNIMVITSPRHYYNNFPNKLLKYEEMLGVNLETLRVYETMNHPTH